MENFFLKKKKNNEDELIEKFDNLMKPYAKYITDTEYHNAINKDILELERNLDPINQVNDKIKDLIDEDKLIDRPPLLFNNNNFIYKGMWNINGEKEGFGVFLEKDGNKYIGGWKQDKFHGYGRLVSKNGDYYEGEWVDGVIEGDGKFFSKKEKK